MHSEDARSPPVSPEELARRQALIAEILDHSERRSIAPLTSADLVREARREEMHGSPEPPA